MKIFGGDIITKVYNTLGADEDMPIASKMISNAVESAQKKVEGRNFSIRKNVLQYDDVMNVQREIIYKQRRQVLDGENIKENIYKMIDSLIDETIASYSSEPQNINREALLQELNANFAISNIESLNKDKINLNDVINEVKDRVHSEYESKEKTIGETQMRELERVVMLKIVDERWMDHIDSMDELKNGIGLRAYGQKDPVVQYRIEGFDMFDQMVNDIKVDVVRFIMNSRKREDNNLQRAQTIKITSSGLEDVNNNTPRKSGAASTTIINNEPKVGRNSLCPCGSGKKYKNCCGKNK